MLRVTVVGSQSFRHVSKHVSNQYLIAVVQARAEFSETRASEFLHELFTDTLYICLF